MGSSCRVLKHSVWSVFAGETSTRFKNLCSCYFMPSIFGFDDSYLVKSYYSRYLQLNVNITTKLGHKSLDWEELKLIDPPKLHWPMEHCFLTELAIFENWSNKFCGKYEFQVFGIISNFTRTCNWLFQSRFILLNRLATKMPHYCLHLEDGFTRNSHPNGSLLMRDTIPLLQIETVVDHVKTKEKGIALRPTTKSSAS